MAASLSVTGGVSQGEEAAALLPEVVVEAEAIVETPPSVVSAPRRLRGMIRCDGILAVRFLHGRPGWKRRPAP